MIGDNFTKNIYGLIAILVAGTVVAWAATRFDDYLVDTVKLKSTSIVITEGMVLAFLLICYVVYNAESRKNLFKDIQKLGLFEWSSFIGLSILGSYIALLLNRSLLHWDTPEFRMTSQLVKLVLGGIFFFLFTEQDFGFKKIFSYLLLAAAALYFHYI